jgi:polyisoprenoid-binding protein YceI
MKQVTAPELAAELDGPQPPLLLHVLPPETWEACRIPGSLCACVYETSFLDQVQGMASSPAAAVVVYGAGRPSLDSAAAVEKLREAGYSDVRDFSGGLAEWKAAGLPTLGSGALPAAPEMDGSWQVDASKSIIRWTGRNLFNHHEGTVKLAGGQVRIEQGQLLEGEFSVDLQTIDCTDLTDPAIRGMLLKHLADRDFFETALHPLAQFGVERAEAIPDATPGTANCHITGTLTLRGVSAPLSFPALVAVAEDNTLTAQAWFELDRTQWGANYGSGRLFAWLGKHVVNDHVGLHLKIHARRTA